MQDIEPGQSVLTWTFSVSVSLKPSLSNQIELLCVTILEPKFQSDSDLEACTSKSRVSECRCSQFERRFRLTAQSQLVIGARSVTSGV